MKTKNKQIVESSMNVERKIIRKSKEIEKELLADGQTFCRVSYLMGALAYKNGDFNK